MSAVGRTVAALVFLLALTVGFYRQLTLVPGYTWLENPDQALQVRPWLDYEARELHAGRLPLWDPYQVGGQSLIGQVQPGIANPLNWILFAMPLRDGHIPLNVLHWYWVLIHWAAAVFCFALCRDLGAGMGASILGASVWAFGGFMGHSGTPQFLMSALWIPIILLFFARVFRGQRPRGSAALCGAAMGLAFLGGHHNVPIYTGVMMGGLWLWYVVSGGLPAALARQRIMHAGIFAIVCVLVSAVQMLPAVEYGRHAIRWAGAPEPQRWKDKIPYSVHAEYSLRARSIPGLVVPGLTLHANPFVGIVALSLALTAVYLRWRSRRVRLLATVALGALMLALGVDTPLHGIAYLLIPMVEKARYPAMAIVISQAAIAALAALGLHALSKATAIDRRPTARWLAGFSAAIFAIYGALFLLHRPPFAHPTWIIGAIALVFAVLLYVWPRSTQASVWALSAAALALFFVEVSTVPLPLQRQNQPDALLKPLADVSDIADFLRRQSGWFRVQIDEDAIPANFGDFYGIEQVDGYLASMPVNIHRILGEHEMPRWFGVEFYAGRKPAKPEQIEVFQSRTGIKVYRNPGIEQPLWIEHDGPCHSLCESALVVGQTPGSARPLRTLSPGESTFQPDARKPTRASAADQGVRPTTRVGGNEHDSPCAIGDHVQVIERTPGAMTIDADLKCDGRVVAGDPWFQGWRAQIDGKRVRIQEYAGVIRAVPVAAGKHRIEFQYRPGSVYWGAALSACGLLLAGLIYRTDHSSHGV